MIIILDDRNRESVGVKTTGIIAGVTIAVIIVAILFVISSVFLQKRYICIMSMSQNKCKKTLLYKEI